MKRILLSGSMIVAFAINAFDQEIPASAEQQLESLTEVGQTETEDDSWLQEMEQFRKDPIDLNTAAAEELKQLRVLTDLQIENLVAYRKLLGMLLKIYELQAVPCWDIPTIKKILPFVTTSDPNNLKEESMLRFRKGGHSILIRISQVLESSIGFKRSSTGSGYLGSPQRLLLRYHYNYKNLLQFGLVGDKDAGEQFFAGKSGKGFDFYSFHLFARNMGIVQSLAIGDYTVNLGQGLIHWQSMGFKKSAVVTGIKRQSATLKPYSSAGEFYFNRGVGLSVKNGKTGLTGFLSLRRLSANVVKDSTNQSAFITSVLNSGYHRTAGELVDRNNFNQVSYGGNLIYKSTKWQLGLNAICHNFSIPIQKRDEPYNIYAISGKSWYNFSFDYGFTYRNLHFFGEAAADKHFDQAFLHGMLLCVDPKIDLSLLHRLIAKEYQAVSGNAFTENTFPTNESGLFTGISIRPFIGWRMEAYADFFKFPWLKFNVDGPSSGKDFLVQITYSPNRQVELYTRFRNEVKQANQKANGTVNNFLVNVQRQAWRTHLIFKPVPAISLRQRFELLWYNNKAIDRETGFLCFFDFIYKPLLSPYSGILRIQYFETEGYNSRVYAYENDVLYGYSVPANAEKGFRYYVMVNYDVGKQLSIWLRLAQTIYRNSSAIGSGLDEIPGSRRTEIKFQVRYLVG